jgi:hypothetical protein
MRDGDACIDGASAIYGDTFLRGKQLINYTP